MLVYFEYFKTDQITYTYLQKYGGVYLHFTYDNIYICYIYNWHQRTCVHLEILIPFQIS